MTELPDLFHIDRSDRGRLKFGGRDRQGFLHALLTNDVASLAPGSGRYAFLLDATGHVLADLRLLCRSDHLLADLEPGMATIVAETLEKYLIMERVKIHDATAELRQIHVGGRKAADLFPSFAGEMAEGTNREIGSDTCAAVTILTGLPGFDLYLPASEFDAALARLESVGSVPVEPSLVDALRIEAGIPRFGVDFDLRVLAPETGLRERAIHYRKGCYIGQEIVARIDARGHTNRELTGFRLDRSDLPASGAPVTLDGKEIGRITSAAVGPRTGSPIALGYLRHEHRTPGTVVTVGDAAARVVSLPLTVGDSTG
ncbi:MAG: glycine cleavage T C-terminal barrel domain-containing protein [Capsulimonadales bacterium]|nr:glycine cleavage T C-terminal barrel domain-containing protein [Capsulimonadales bacterium]